MNMNRNFSIIFISGVHGVGKTTFCNSFKKIIDAESISASDIIKKNIKINKDKVVSDIQGNQDHLVEGLSTLDIDKPILLLDGHFCLLNQDNTIKNVPSSTFESIQPMYVILLCCDAENIHDRLITRDRQNAWGKYFIKEMQDKEKNRAVEVCKRLSLPLIEYDVSSSISTKDLTSLAEVIGLNQ